jgi:hypothetical protein
MEKKINGKIPYLDLLVTKDFNQQIQTECYKKATSTGRVINYRSNCHINIKTNTAMGLINRIFQLDKTNNDTKKIKTVQDILQNNNYPKNLIHSLIKQYKNNCNKLDNTEKENNIKYRSIPYIKGLSEKVSKIIKSEVDHIQFAFKNKKSELFSKLKDKTDPMLKTNLIYSIPCSADGCTGQYTGLTNTYLKKQNQQSQ